MWNVPVGLLPSVQGVPTDIIKNNSPTIMKTKLVFRDVCIYIYDLILL
jgi:hypothetical protein